MAVISEDYRYLFVLSPRTASTALSNGVLVPHLGGAWIPSTDMTLDDGSKIPQKHTTVQQLLDGRLIEPDELGEYHVFVGVRNPFDSLVSLFTKIVNNYAERIEEDPGHFYLANNRARVELRAAVEGGFNSWIVQKYGEKVGKRDPIHFHAKWMDRAESFLRFECLSEDFRALCEKLHMPEHEIPAMNITAGRKRYRTYYSSESRAIVEELFSPTLEQFDYTF